MTRGILFWASGSRFVDEAQKADEQVHRVWPEIDTFIDRTLALTTPPLLARIEAMSRSPFDETLFMDSDTWLVDPVPELFELMSRFDLAVPFATYREVYPVHTPASFPELNPGVMVWRMNSATVDLLRDWKIRFQRHYTERKGVSHPKVGFFHSQPSFREALFHSDVIFTILPDEYNWRGSGYVHHKVKIVHKRPDPEKEARRINEHAGRPRTALLFGDVQVWS